MDNRVGAEQIRNPTTIRHHWTTGWRQSFFEGQSSSHLLGHATVFAAQPAINICRRSLNLCRFPQLFVDLLKGKNSLDYYKIFSLHKKSCKRFIKYFLCTKKVARDLFWEWANNLDHINSDFRGLILPQSNSARKCLFCKFIFKKNSFFLCSIF